MWPGPAGMRTEAFVILMSLSAVGMTHLVLEMKKESIKPTVQGMNLFS